MHKYHSRKLWTKENHKEQILLSQSQLLIELLKKVQMTEIVLHLTHLLQEVDEDRSERNLKLKSLVDGKKQ